MENGGLDITVLLMDFVVGLAKKLYEVYFVLKLRESRKKELVWL